MELYLLRHADADTVAPTDDQRFLSEKGIQQASRVARFCDAHNIRPSVVLTSPIRRAHQTASEVATLLKSKLVSVNWLACGAVPAHTLERLDEFKMEQTVMLVGHEPDMSWLASTLIGAPGNGGLHVRKGSLTLIDLPELTAGAGRIEFSIPVRLM